MPSQADQGSPAPGFDRPGSFDYLAWLALAGPIYVERPRTARNLAERAARVPSLALTARYMLPWEGDAAFLAQFSTISVTYGDELVVMFDAIVEGIRREGSPNLGVTTQVRLPMDAQRRP